MQKQKLLFVIESLGSGGAEKSIVTLLSLLGYDKYEVDLQLFSYGGINQRFVSKEVNLLPPLPYFEYCRKPIYKQILDPTSFVSRMRYSMGIRKDGLTHPDKARVFWQYSKDRFKPTEKEYDVAIAYAQGIPTFYVMDKVRAKRKFAWVNVGMKINEESQKYYLDYFKKYDKVNTVSDSAHRDFLSVFPTFDKDKLVIIRDILSSRFIKGLAEIEQDRLVDGEGYIITIARLTPAQKGMDILLDVCKILKDRGIDYKWYIIGEGSYRTEMEAFIKEHGLENNLKLLGTCANPYATLKHAAIYAQTSRHEGFGLSIAEARMLGIPVVTTAYQGYDVQMKPGKNGIVVPIEAEAVANAIIDLLNNPQNRQEISDFQATEKIDNEEEVEKFNELTLKHY